MTLRIGSLCTGTGALDMAVMDVFGGSMAWHCQYDPDDRHQYAARILEHHWPGVPNHGDISATDWTQVEPVDVLTAGFPCQDLSYAGRGAGIKEGTRSGLWYAVARAIGALRPRIVVLENVRAIVGRRPGLDVVLASLAELGFDAEWVCVPASDVGAPHERFRWFLLAWPAADAAGDGWHEGWAEPAGIVGRPDAAFCGDGVPADAFGGELQRRGEPVELGDPARGAEGSGDQRQRDGDAADDRGAEAGVVAWGQFEPAIRRWERVLGRPAPRPTEPGRTGDRLSPAFVEWMMGLPAGWVTDVPGLPRNAQLKALGNGVVRHQAAYALRLLLARASRDEVAA